MMWVYVFTLPTTFTMRDLATTFTKKMELKVSQNVLSIVIVVSLTVQYHPGFGSEISTEALPGALPKGQVLQA